MRADALDRADVRLGYCTNVHPYTDVEGLLDVLRGPAAEVRDRAGEGGALDVGLWLPAAVARAVADDPAPLRRVLEEQHMRCFTVNAFPFGDFHGRRVKDGVFRPSWADPARLEYTLAAARALAHLLPAGGRGSLSTHTGAFKRWDDGPSDAELAAGYLAAAEGLARLEDETGRRVVLALEPEPLSRLETTDETVRFFAEHLQPAGEAARRHLGVCYDACHQAVEFEDVRASLDALVAAEIPIAKVQVSVAVVVPDVEAALEDLAGLVEDRWLHQVVARGADGSLTRHEDLPVALADARARAAQEWRVHFHVPLFADALDARGRLRTTRASCVEDLDHSLSIGATSDFEIETYSFELVARERRRAWGVEDLPAGIAREFEWVRSVFVSNAADARPLRPDDA